VHVCKYHLLYVANLATLRDAKNVCQSQPTSSGILHINNVLFPLVQLLEKFETTSFLKCKPYFLWLFVCYVQNAETSDVPSLKPAPLLNPVSVWVCVCACGGGWIGACVLWACPASWLSLLRFWGCPCGHRRQSESDVRVCLCCLSLFALAHPHKATTRITHTDNQIHAHTHTAWHMHKCICFCCCSRLPL